MYLTAQRVVSPKSREMGVNVYKYVHWKDWGATAVPDEFLPSVNPGELVKQDIKVMPPGNRVLSYLDVVLPDSTDARTVRGFLLSLKLALPTESLPVSRRLGNGWASFNMADLRVPKSTELGALAGTLLLKLYPEL